MFITQKNMHSKTIIDLSRNPIRIVSEREWLLGYHEKVERMAKRLLPQEESDLCGMALDLTEDMIEKIRQAMAKRGIVVDLL